MNATRNSRPAPTGDSALDEVNELLERSLGRPMLYPLVRANDFGGYDYGQRPGRAGDPIVRTTRDDCRIGIYTFAPNSGCSGSIHFAGGAARADLVAPIVAAYFQAA